VALPLNVTATLDSREFKAALREYQAATKKDWAYVSNRQALNVAIKTGQRTPLANPEKIKRLTERPWWPKLVAKTIVGKGVRVRDGKTKGGKAKFRKIKGSYTREEARRASKALIQKRLNRIGFIRSGWLPAIQILTALKMKAKGNYQARLKGTGKIQKPKGDCKPANPGLKPVAVIINNSQGAEKVGAKALQEGISAAAVDMREFIADRGKETASRFNAGRHH
jgi:hypothetical protein